MSLKRSLRSWKRPLATFHDTVHSQKAPLEENEEKKEILVQGEERNDGQSES